MPVLQTMSGNNVCNTGNNKLHYLSTAKSAMQVHRQLRHFILTKSFQHNSTLLRFSYIPISTQFCLVLLGINMLTITLATDSQSQWITEWKVSSFLSLIMIVMKMLMAIRASAVVQNNVDETDDDKRSVMPRHCSCAHPQVRRRIVHTLFCTGN